MMSRVPLRMICLLLIASCSDKTTAPGSSTEFSGQNWPLFRGVANMTGAVNVEITFPLHLAWSFESGESISATPVISDGRVFIGSRDKYFYCLDLKTGQELWKFRTKLGVDGAACLTTDLVCFGEADGIVYALKQQTGEEVWRYETGDAVAGGLNIYRAKNGRNLILAGSDDYFLHAIDAKTGQSAWQVETDNYIKGAPSVDQESGVVIFGGCDEILRLIDADTGELASSIEIGAYMANSCAVRDQIAYVAHYAGTVMAIDLASGEKAWSYVVEDGTEFVASPAVSEDLVVVGAQDKELRAFERSTGRLRWEFSARKSIDSSALIATNAILVASDDGRIYGVGPEDGAELWSYEIGARINSSPVYCQGFVVIGAGDGKVYAFSLFENTEETTRQ